MFQQLPDAADVYILSRVLHDWHDDDAVRILKAIHASSEKSDASVMLIERVVLQPGEHVSKARPSSSIYLCIYTLM